MRKTPNTQLVSTETPEYLAQVNEAFQCFQRIALDLKSLGFNCAYSSLLQAYKVFEQEITNESGQKKQ